MVDGFSLLANYAAALAIVMAVITMAIAYIVQLDRWFKRYKIRLV